LNFFDFFPVNKLNLRCGRFAFENMMKFKDTGVGWQPQPHPGTLSYTVSLHFCINQKENYHLMQF